MPSPTPKAAPTAPPHIHTQVAKRLWLAISDLATLNPGNEWAQRLRYLLDFTLRTDTYRESSDTRMYPLWKLFSVAYAWVWETCEHKPTRTPNLDLVDVAREEAIASWDDLERRFGIAYDAVRREAGSAIDALILPLALTVAALYLWKR